MNPESIQFLSLGLMLLASISGGIYLRMAWGIWKRGGQVAPERFILADLLMALTLIGFLVMLGVQHYLHPPAKMALKAEHILPGSLIQVMVALGIAGFLRFRGIRVRQLFGLQGERFPGALGKALVLLLAALPLLFVIAAATHAWLEKSAVEQDLVQLFRDVVKRGDHAAMAQIAFSAAILAPLTEEFVFRGYFYGVGKRYLGALASAFLSSGLFAASHLNLVSFPSLFALALCFAVAYELTGSLLVPMSMHALFNSMSLAMLYWQATQTP